MIFSFGAIASFRRFSVVGGTIPALILVVLVSGAYSPSAAAADFSCYNGFLMPAAVTVSGASECIAEVRDVYEPHCEAKAAAAPTIYTGNSHLLSDLTTYQAPGIEHQWSGQYSCELHSGGYHQVTTFNLKLPTNSCQDPGYTLDTSTGECIPADDHRLTAPDAQGQCPTTDQTHPCDVSTGNKILTEVDYSANGALRFSRYYNSLGAYRSAEHFAHGWRHTYSRAMDERPDKFPMPSYLAPSGNQSASYATDQDACETGWGDIKDTVWGGDLSTATASFSGGNVCEISSGGSTKAYFVVQDALSRASFAGPATLHTISRPNGSVLQFKQSGTDWINELNPAYTLVASGSDWVFTDLNDTEETYDSTGKLTQIRYRNGQTETLTYDLTAGQGGDDNSDTLDRVTGPFGHTLTFGYDANSRLDTVTTPDGVIQYGYDAKDNLTSATYPDLTDREYLYEHPFLRNHLTGRIDEKNDEIASYEYDDSGRAILTELADGQESVQLVYNASGSTTLTLANGATRDYVFSVEQGDRKPTMITGDVCSTCPGGNIADRTYDANGFLDEIGDWNGNLTQTIRNVRGLTGTLIEGKGSTEQRTTTTTWHASYRLPTQIVSPKNTADFSYDGNGNLLSLTVSGSGKTRVWAFTYNANGQPLTIDGPRTDVSDVTTLAYYTCTTGNECGQLQSVTNALSQVTTYDSYDSAGRLTQMTGPNGLQTSFTYDTRGRVLTVTEAPSVGTARTTTMTYDDAGQLTTLTLPNGTVLTYTYDAAHYLTSVTDNLDNQTTYAYDVMGNLIDEDTYDPSSVLKRTLEYAHDLNNRLDTVTSGTVTTDVTLDLVGNLTAETDANSNTTQHTYDALNRLDSTLDALSGTINYDYDDHDKLTQVAAANGATTDYVYDALDNLTSEASPDRGTTTYTYDNAGNRLTMTDARGVTATYAYDASNRLTSVSYPNTSENVTYTYDHAGSNSVGRLRSISDESGTTTYTYNEFGEILTDQRQIGTVTLTTSYQYDAAGNVSSTTYPSGRLVDFTRDAIGQVTQVTSTKDSISKTIVSSAAYEPFGPLASLTYGNGLTVDYAHRTDYSTTSINSGNWWDKSYVYDAAGNILQINDSDFLLNQTFTYNALNQLTSDSTAHASGYGDTVLLSSPAAYWRLGEASQYTAVDATGNGFDGSSTTSLTWGLTGLYTSATDTAIRINGSYRYIVTSPLVGHTVTGVEFWFNTDPATSLGHLVSVHETSTDQIALYHRRSDKKLVVFGFDVWADVYESDSSVTESVAHHVALWYEPASDKTYMMIDGVTQQNTYTGNLLGQQSPEIIIGGYKNGSITARARGEFDEVVIYDGPVTESTFSGRYSLADGSSVGVSTDFTYDANGNRTSIDDGSTVTTYAYQAQSNELASIGGSTLTHGQAGNRTADAGGIRTYSYNDAGRLVEVFDNSISTATYQHNALGQRVKKTVGSNTTLFVYDRDGNLLAEHDATGTLIRDYVWMNGAPVAQIDTSETFSYLHFDHLNTPRKATNDAQTVVWQWNSDAFGNGLADGDPDSDSTVTTVNLRFPGQYYDQETGLHYNFFRTYEPSTGRYLESDPIGLSGGLNTYGYVGGNPLSNTDPFGLFMSSVDAACVTNPVLCAELMGDVSRIPQNLADKHDICIESYDADDLMATLAEIPVAAEVTEAVVMLAMIRKGKVPKRNANYTQRSRSHVYGHGHAANSPVQPGSSRFRPTEGGQKFTNEVINHPSVRRTHQSNGRTLHEVDDLGRTTGRGRDGSLVRGGAVVVEGQNPASWSNYVPNEVVTQFPR